MKFSRTWSAVRTGSVHLRANKPCQDAAALWRGRMPQGMVTILAIADGHGDSKYDLSEFGAQLAVQTALSSLRSFCRRFHDSTSLLYDALRHDFAHRMTRQWRQAVQRHHLEHFPHEHNNFNEPLISLYRRYGTTLMFALVFDNCLLGGQIGDGDLTVITSDGRVTRPIPAAEPLVANETHSLTSLDSIRLWRFCHWTLFAPCLVSLNTDGLSNAFADDESFFDFLRSLVKNIDQYTFKKTMAIVPTFLDKVSAEGSGDDVTLALYWQKE